MLNNRASGDAGCFAAKLIGAHFVAPLAAQQRRKFIKYELHRSNNAQHGGQFHQNCERFEAYSACDITALGT
jgi:hypothetical protein